jgi:hypothetical protein
MCCGPAEGSCDRCAKMHKGCEVGAPPVAGAGRGGARRVAGARRAAAKPKAKGKAKAESPEAGPSKPLKRARIYELEPPTDLESDELAAAVLDVGAEMMGMGEAMGEAMKRGAAVGEAMKRLGAAVRRVGDALNKHDL